MAKKTTKKPKSPVPGGLGITRSRNAYTFTWAGGYDEAVNVQYALHIGYWTYSSAFSVGAGATSYTLLIGEGNYIPNTSTPLYAVSFRVQGDKKKTEEKKKKKTIVNNWQMSDWSGWCQLDLYAPYPPVVTYEKSSQYKTTFTMNLPNHVNDRQWYGTHIQYRSCLRLDADDVNAGDIPESEWGPITRQNIYNSVTQQDTTTFTYIENDEEFSADIENATSAVRWFEARAIGPGGASSWVASAISYSSPYPGVVTKSTVKPTGRKSLDCKTELDYQISRSHPIDTVKIQYSFASPGGVYAEYSATNDTDIKTGKSYYTITPTAVADPVTDNLFEYYEKNEKYYSTGKVKYYYNQVTEPTGNPHNQGWYEYDSTEGYILTDDTTVISEKNYYQRTTGIIQGVDIFQATKVNSPNIANIGTYWEATENIVTEKQQRTHKKYSYHTRAIRDKKRKRREETIKEVIGTETVYVDVTIQKDYYFNRTIDTEINENKDYYTIEQVNNPSVDGLPDSLPNTEVTSYLYKDRTYYYKTDDEVLDKNTKYYTVDASLVVSPVRANLSQYYDLVSTNYLAPIDPSWSDAEIGGDNTIIPDRSLGALTTCHSAVSFQVDGDMPEDKLLYVRVNTIQGNMTTNGASFLCTDENGNNIYKETLLSSPTVSVGALSENRLPVEIHNNSDAVGVRIAVLILPPEDSTDTVETIGVIIPNQNGEANATIEVPPKYLTTGFGIGAYAFIGQYGFAGRITGTSGAIGATGATGSTGAEMGYNLYAISALLKSKLTTFGGEIPIPPTNVDADHIGNGNVLVTWDWNWKKADYAEVAWSDYNEALDSNEQPTTYQVPNSKNSRLIVRNLELGKTWYFWVRLGKEENTSIWSNVVFENLSSSPSVPSLNLSRRYITLDDKFTANWTYVSTDGTTQSSAQICECAVSGNDVFYGNIIAEIPNEENQDKESQYIILDPQSNRLSWVEGSDHYLAVRVTSESGMISEKWSDYVPISVISSIDSSLNSSSLYPSAVDYDDTSTYSVDDYTIKRIPDPDDPEKDKGVLYKCVSSISTPEEWNEEHWMIDPNQPYQELRSLPLTAMVDSTADNVETNLIIERSKEYFLDRPDESTKSGHIGETIVQATDYGDGLFSIDQEDLTSYLDDGAFYYMTTRVTDNYGQSREVRYEFVVNWTHQALMPKAEMVVDREYNVSKITIQSPDDIPTGDSIIGDVCDIYRKSADGYVILYENAEFNNTYVDPYPTLGDHGGYRVVYRTRNGDYITADKSFAWLDLDDEEDMIHSPSHIIDFEDGTVELMYNVDIDNNWRKDFQETKYLGGSIQGDWNEGVSKTTSMNCNVLTYDWDTISDMRKLAAYTGECHVRTRDGSNFLANVEVSEKLPYAVYTDPNCNTTQLCEYSLSITKLDPIEPDGMTLEDWLDTVGVTGATGATGATGTTGT